MSTVPEAVVALLQCAHSCVTCECTNSASHAMPAQACRPQLPAPHAAHGWFSDLGSMPALIRRCTVRSTAGAEAVGNAAWDRGKDRMLPPAVCQGQMCRLHAASTGTGSTTRPGPAPRRRRTLLHVHTARQVEEAAQHIAVAVLLRNPLPRPLGIRVHGAARLVAHLRVWCGRSGNRNIKVRACAAKS